MPAAPLDIDTLLAQFPKVRPPLPDAYARIYTQYYQANRGGCTPASALAQRVESWLHRQVARDVRRPGTAAERHPEIGAGTLNHLPYEPATTRMTLSSPLRPCTPTRPGGPASAISGAICATCTCMPAMPASSPSPPSNTWRPCPWCWPGHRTTPRALRRPARGHPERRHWLWRLGWHVADRTRVSPPVRPRLRRAHAPRARQHGPEIAALLRYFYGTVRQRVCGLSPAHSLYQFYAASDPRLDRCGAYLARSG